MKVFIGSSDTGAIIYILGETLKKRGHEVITASYEYAFQNFEYDHHPEKFLELTTNNALLRKFYVFLKNNAFRVYRLLSERKKMSLLKKMDLYIYIWSPFLETDEKLLIFLKKHNVKILTLFLGSEVRNYRTFVQKFELERKWNFPLSLLDGNNDEKLKKLRVHEKYSDVIFSVPDQAIESRRSYHHVFIPIPLSELPYKPKARKVPLIVHAPTDPYKKGTDLILKTIDDLRSEGLEFHFLLIRNMKKVKLLKLLSIADILVDEIILHGPGIMSLEAMASGCLSMTKHFKDSPKEFQPPIVSINENNIKERLKYFIENPQERLKIIEPARIYVEEHNAPDKVVDYYFDCLNKKIEEQYKAR